MESGVIIVAVDSSEETSQTALKWAVRNVVKPSDVLFLLAIISSQPNSLEGDRHLHQSRASQSFSTLVKKWILRHAEKKPSADVMRLAQEAEHDRVKRVESAYELMVQKILSSHNLQKVRAEVRVLADAQNGSVASIAGELGANWVVLDRHLKKEGECCLKQLICNIVVVDHANPRILRSVDSTINKLNAAPESSNQITADMQDLVPVFSHGSNETGSTVTRSSLGLESSEYKNSLSTTDLRPNASYIPLNSQYFLEGINKQPGSYSPSQMKTKATTLNKGSSFSIKRQPQRASEILWDRKRKSYSGPLKTGIAPARRSVDSSTFSRAVMQRSNLSNILIPEKLALIRHNGENNEENPLALGRTTTIRRDMDLTIKHPRTPPPLCSKCKHKSPQFGKASRKFSYEEIEIATDGFSVQNLLAEGGFGLVYRGNLPDGLVVAVKKPKFRSAQGASEFCSEVEVLSCAQHKNLVMLVGYCSEVEWLLVYEYVCNNSLDKHLYGKDVGEVMAWKNRMKVARGAARGLRYLHEDCRVGCIVHRDFRPNNILLTHDFEPVVGDFGLARRQADGQLADETRVMGAFGYLAPEYTQSGLITEKADVYAYGVVLLELLSGYKATEFSRKTGKQFVSEWGLPLLQNGNIAELIDPRLANDYVLEEVKTMVHAAEICLLPVPEQRPRMSQVLKILAEDTPTSFMHERAQYANEITDRISASRLTWLMSSTIHQPMQRSESTNKIKEIAFNSTVSIDSYQDESGRSDASKQSVSLASEEYQQYLKDSLAKFIQNINVK